ncbi:MAG TPA: hypothetical protein VKB71_13880 [Rhizomicrobium sp.]|nr:hypothetical protein [Rhizomicrobium sp.]
MTGRRALKVQYYLRRAQNADVFAETAADARFWLGIGDEWRLLARLLKEAIN